MKAERPILRYHGGKWMLAEWIISHFPPHRVYIEPFGGAASVLLQKRRSYSECYNDLSGELVNLFRVMRDRGPELQAQLILTPFARREYALSFEVCEDELEQARRTIIRSFMGFGSNALCRAVKSGFRFNANISGTTPAHDWANLPGSQDAIIERLQGVVLECRPGGEIIEALDSRETLIYADPPYVHSTRMSQNGSHHGYDFEMSDAEHKTLAQQLRGADGMVILSGYHCDLYDELYGDWTRVEKAALADGARKRTEVLWLNPAAVAGRSQGHLYEATA